MGGGFEKVTSSKIGNNGADASNVMLGDMLEVRLSWMADDLGSKLSFVADTCTVSHGDLSVKGSKLYHIIHKCLFN